MIGNQSVAEQCVDIALSESTIEQDETLEGLYQKARDGNPFPLIAHQWPSLLVDDPAEQPFFRGTPGDPDDPCLRLDDWQREHILAPFFDEAIYEIAIKGNTKPGKGASVAIGINLWFEIYQQSKVIITSANAARAKDVTFGEVIKWRRQMKFTTGRVLQRSVADTDQHYMEVANPLKPEAFSGQHGPRTLIVIDESSGVPDRFYEDAGKQAAKIVAIGNPRGLSGWFFNMYNKCEGGKAGKNDTQTVKATMGLRKCVTVGATDCMNVRHNRLERPVGPPGGLAIKGRMFEQGDHIPEAYYRHVKLLIPNQVDYARYLALLSHRDSRVVAWSVHGHFPDEDPEKQVILSSWLDRHTKAYRDRWQEIKVVAFGLDVARSIDGDSSCLTYGGESGILGQQLWQLDDGVLVAKAVVRFAMDKLSIDLTKGRHPVVVDMDGIGVGVGDILRRMTIVGGKIKVLDELSDDDEIHRPGVWVIEFRGNDVSSVDPRTYKNLRAEAYSTLGRRLNPKDRWQFTEFLLPDDGELREELCAPEKKYQGGDQLRYYLCPKDDIKTSLGRSPDKGDSAVYFFHGLRELLNMNADFMAWEKTSIVKVADADERRSLRGRDADDFIDPSDIGKKKHDWGAGLSFARPDGDD